MFSVIITTFIYSSIFKLISPFYDVGSCFNGWIWSDFVCKNRNSLNKVGLSEYNELKIFEISGGEQQRVALARAMIKPSKIILVDEPTGALDSKNRDEVLQLLREINKQRKTIVIVTHDMTVANSCDRIIQL